MGIELRPPGRRIGLDRGIGQHEDADEVPTESGNAPKASSGPPMSGEVKPPHVGMSVEHVGAEGSESGLSGHAEMPMAI
jgi:hypothetical protein